MDGSSLSLILIPVVVSISLAAWLIMVYYAASHPRWREQSPARGHARPPAAGTAAADRQRRSPRLPKQSGMDAGVPRPAAAYREPASARAAAAAADPAHAA